MSQLADRYGHLTFDRLRRAGEERAADCLEKDFAESTQKATETKRVA